MHNILFLVTSRVQARYRESTSNNSATGSSIFEGPHSEVIRQQAAKGSNTRRGATHLSGKETGRDLESVVSKSILRHDWREGWVRYSGCVLMGPAEGLTCVYLALAYVLVSFVSDLFYHALTHQLPF